VDDPPSVVAIQPDGMITCILKPDNVSALLVSLIDSLGECSIDSSRAGLQDAVGQKSISA